MTDQNEQQRQAPYSECTPSFTLQHHIDSLRLGDPEKWQRLQKEWQSC